MYLLNSYIRTYEHRLPRIYSFICNRRQDSSSVPHGASRPDNCPARRLGPRRALTGPYAPGSGTGLPVWVRFGPEAATARHAVPVKGLTPRQGTRAGASAPPGTGTNALGDVCAHERPDAVLRRHLRSAGAQQQIDEPAAVSQKVVDGNGIRGWSWRGESCRCDRVGGPEGQASGPAEASGKQRWQAMGHRRPGAGPEGMRLRRKPSFWGYFRSPQI